MHAQPRGLALLFLCLSQGWPGHRAQSSGSHCTIIVGKCRSHPYIVGSMDDSEEAYNTLHVDQEDNCLARARFYWDLCSNKPTDDSIVVRFNPTGRNASYPDPGEVQLAKEQNETYIASYARRDYLPLAEEILQTAGLSPTNSRFILPASVPLSEADDLRPASRGKCWTRVLMCHLVPHFSGTGDDVDEAYEKDGVGENETACLGRARFYWELCGSDGFQQAETTYLPTGARSVFPSDEEVFPHRLAPGCDSNKHFHHWL